MIQVNKEREVKRLSLTIVPASLRGRQKGSVLITVIVSIVVFAVLGVAMYSMFSTSLFGVSSANDAKRSSYLAESGARYLLSETRNSQQQEVITTLFGLDKKTFQVKNSGSFSLDVYPYFGEVTAVSGNVVTVNFDGSGFPEEFTLPANAMLQVGINNARTITATYPSPIPKGHTPVKFTLGGTAITLGTGTVHTVFHFPTINSSQPYSKGCDLILSIPTTSGLPVKNGSFVDYSTGYSYQYRSAAVQAGQVVLKDVSLISGVSGTFNENTYLVFSRAAKVESSGARNSTQKLFTDTFTSGASGIGAPPPQNIPLPGADGLTAFDPTTSGGIVTTQTLAPGGTWLAFQVAPSYYSPDPESPNPPGNCQIGYYVLPISDTGSPSLRDQLRNSWLMNRQLSYDVQTKVAWDPNLLYGVTGIAFRWHENPIGSGLFEGFVLSFMRYQQSTGCLSGYTGEDAIPNKIKPYKDNPSDLSGKTLLVLWQQRVVAGSIQRRWLAYALLGDPYNRDGSYDDKVVGNQGSSLGSSDGIGINNDATILVRIEDAVLSDGTGTRVNNIKLFWGDASSNYDSAPDRTNAPDAIATNLIRKRYDPQWNSGPFPRWPSNKLGPISSTTTTTIVNWFPDPNVVPARTIDWYDYFTLASKAPVTTPGHDPTAVKLFLNPDLTWLPPGDVVKLLDDDCTVQTNYFTLVNYEQDRSEIGLIAMGRLYSYSLNMQDFAIQILGARE